MKAAIFLLLFLLNVAAGQAECPPLYIPVGDGCYTFSDVDYKWPDASLYCQYAGGYLAKIDSDYEQFRLKEYYDEHLTSTGGYFWIGATDALFEGTYRWAPSGKAVTFTNWESGYPTNSCQCSDCAYWVPILDVWRNIDCCTFTSRPLCEIDPL